MASLVNRVQEAFSDVTDNLPEKVLQKAAAMVDSFDMQPSDLFAVWEASQMNRKASLDKVTLRSLEAAEASILKTQKSASNKSAGLGNTAAKRRNDGISLQRDNKRPRSALYTKDTLGQKVAAAPHTPVLTKSRGGDSASKTKPKTKNQTASQKEVMSGEKLSFTPLSSQAYKNRKNAGMVHKPVFNSHISPIGNDGTYERDASKSRCTITTVQVPGTDAEQQKLRYMYTSLEQRAVALKERGLAMQDALQKEHSLPEPARVGMPSQDACMVMGQIVNESSQGRLMKKSVVMESYETGARTKLDLQDCAEYALFPGQTVAARGINSSGKNMLVQKVFSCAAPPVPTTTRAKLQAFGHSSDFCGGAPLCVFVAAGPFTTDDNVQYDPLQDLVDTVATSNPPPDVVILLGPFIDANSTMIQSGHAVFKSGGYEMDLNFEELKQMIMKKITADLPASTKVILVPSVRDIHHDTVYPQQPFDLSACNLNKEEQEQVFVMPNPCTFRINEVVFGISTEGASSTLYSLFFTLYSFLFSLSLSRSFELKLTQSTTLIFVRRHQRRNRSVAHNDA